MLIAIWIALLCKGHFSSEFGLKGCWYMFMGVLTIMMYDYSMILISVEGHFMDYSWLLRKAGQVLHLGSFQTKAVIVLED